MKMEMKKRDVAEAIIYNERKEVLMQKKTIDYPIYPGGVWCFFGGEVEDNENPLETVKREIKEEIGIEADDEDIELVYERDYKIDTRFEGKQYGFKVRFRGKLSDIRLNEGAGFAFFDKSEFDRINIPNMEKNSLDAF